MNSPDNYSREYHEHCEGLAEKAGLIPMKANIVTHIDDFDAGGPGTAMFTEGNSSLLIKCPGCGEASALPLDDSTRLNRPGWKLESAEPVTLSPSVFHDVAGCGWHGYLRNGEFVK